VSRAPGGRVLVRVERLPRLGEQVYSRSGKPIGRVEDILGPVASPFASVKLGADRPPPGGLEGAQVYVAEREDARPGEWRIRLARR